MADGCGWGAARADAVGEDWCPFAAIDAALDARLWALLRVAPGAEKAAAAGLRERGLMAFFPTRVEWRHASAFAKAAGRPKVKRVSALAPGYVVAGLTPGFPEWVRALRAPHVLGVIEDAGGRPVILRRRGRGPHEARRFAGLSDEAPRSWRRMRSGEEFGVGDRVVAVGGPLEHWRGVALAVGEERALVAFDPSGREAWVRLDQLALAR